MAVDSFQHVGLDKYMRYSKYQQDVLTILEAMSNSAL